MRFGRRLPVLLLLVIAMPVLFLASCEPYPGLAQLGLSDAIALSKSQNVKSLVFDTDKSRMVITISAPADSPLDLIDIRTGQGTTVKDGDRVVADIDSMNLANLEALGFVLPRDYTVVSPSGSNLGAVLGTIAPLLILGLLFLFLMGARGGANQAMNFGRSRARLIVADKPTVTFSDIAGVEEAKQELYEVVDFLKNRAKFQILGARIPRGVLLVGPPGTGKTLMARAVAGEAGVPFFSISGSEFVEMFVGVGAARVRDLFEQAKRSTPCIIFIDEIDAVGRQRGISLMTSHDEREQTLNQILTEMDGFTPNTGIIVLAATNRPDVLDPALLRPGRFDRRVMLDLPDTNGRRAILEVHAKGKPLDKSLDLGAVARETHGFSGADLANLVNEAAILAARQSKKIIGMEDIEEAIDRVIAGPERKSRKIGQKDRLITAYHEAGHALVARTLPNANPVTKISIIARGGMGGFTRTTPEEERYLMTRSQLQDTLATLTAGHTAEEVMFTEVSTGSSNDIKQATDLAHKMVTDYGMSASLVLRTFGGRDGPSFRGFDGGEGRDYSEELARQIDEEVRKLMDAAHATARKVLTENKARLTYIAETLLAEETLQGERLEAVFKEPVTRPATS